MSWYGGNQYELDRAEQEAFQKLARGFPKAPKRGANHPSTGNTMIWNSYWSPYPFELRLTKVDGIHFCWDELCD